MNKLMAAAGGQGRWSLLVLLALLLVACGGNLEEEILGEWQEVDGPERISLSADGEIVLRYQDMELEGQYSFVASDTILLDLRGPQVSSEPIEVPVAVEDETLYFRMPDGRVASYRRVDPQQ